jgi:hypothetical protein
MSSTLARLQRLSFLNAKTQPQDCFALIVPDGPSTLLILSCLKHLRTSFCVSVCTLVLVMQVNVYQLLWHRKDDARLELH